MATNDKYDRQLRLWGAAGQRRLAAAHVLLLGAGPTGTETLKNLVLPGIGKFTVVDERVVAAADAANNFFLPADRLGAPRSQVACELLRELNPDVKGDWVQADPVAYAKESSLAPFTIVITAGLREDQLLQIEDVFTSKDTPVVATRSLGFIGTCRVIARAHCVIESKPSPAPMEDLRLADPFPSLAAFAESIQPEQLDDKDHAHVPYCVLLLWLAKLWRAEHGGQLPTKLEDKSAFRARAKTLGRKTFGEEVNVMEAAENAYLAYTPRPVPPEVTELFEDPQCDSAQSVSSDEFNTKFWIMCKALRGFVASEGEGKLPVSGKLPDMTASTELFVSLQRVYQQKAAEDVAAVMERVRAVLKELGRPLDFISEEEVRDFCKNARDLRAIRFRALSEEVDPTKVERDDIEMAVMEGVGDATPQCPLLFYYMLRAADRFHAKHGRFPGATGELVLTSPADAVELEKVSHALLTDLGLGETIQLSNAHAQEIARYGGVELHNVAAVIGGIAAQEAVKLVTHQYIPMDNTHVFNGITCTGAVYRM